MDAKEERDLFFMSRLDACTVESLTRSSMGMRVLIEADETCGLVVP